MKLELVSWNIRGTRALIQSNPAVMSRNEASGDKISTTKKTETKTAYDEAKAQLYINDEGQFYHPSLAFWKALFIAAPNRKFSKTAASTVVAQGVAVVEEEFILLDPDSLNDRKPKPLTEKDWVHDLRRAVNKKAGGLIVSRPKWRKWGGILTLEIDREFISNLAPFTELLNIAGRFGIGVGRIKPCEGKGGWGGMNLGKFAAELRNGAE